MSSILMIPDAIRRTCLAELVRAGFSTLHAQSQLKDQKGVWDYLRAQACQPMPHHAKAHQCTPHTPPRGTSYIMSLTVWQTCTLCCPLSPSTALPTTHIQIEKPWRSMAEVQAMASDFYLMCAGDTCMFLLWHQPQGRLAPQELPGRFHDFFFYMLKHPRALLHIHKQPWRLWVQYLACLLSWTTFPLLPPWNSSLALVGRLYAFSETTTLQLHLSWVVPPISTRGSLSTAYCGSNYAKTS